MDQNRNTAILKELRLHMKETGKRQYEVAAEIGAPPQTVNRWFTGGTTISKAYYNLMIVKGIVKGERWS